MCHIKLVCVKIKWIDLPIANATFNLHKFEVKINTINAVESQKKILSIILFSYSP